MPAGSIVADRRADGDRLALLDLDLEDARARCRTTLLALSVSSSNSGSPALTGSPSALSQRDMMPSVIDSPTPGTVIGTAAACSAHSWPHRHGGAVSNRRGGHQVRHGRAHGGLDDLGLFAVVDQVRAGRRAGAGVAADVLDGQTHQLLEPGATNVHAPMFCDSSWTQTHSRAER